MAKVYQSLLEDMPTGGISKEDVQALIAEALKDYQAKITLGEGLGWADETNNTIIVTNKVNALDGAVTLNPDDFVADSGTIKVKK